MEITTEHGTIEEKKQTKEVSLYNLDAIISAGYHVNSIRAKRIDIILEDGGDAILTDAGRISAEFAKAFADAEFEKYRIKQDRLFCFDFDRFNKDGLLPLEFKPDGE